MSDSEESEDADEYIQLKDLRFYLPRERPIKKLYGDERDDGQTVEEWQEEVRWAWRSQRLDKQEKLELIHQNIGPLVKAELRAASEKVRNSPSKVLDLISREFGEVRSPTELYLAFLNIRQEIGESARLYANRLLSAFDRLQKRQSALKDRPADEKVLVQQYVRTVRDPVLASTLREKLHQKPNVEFRELRETAIRWSNDDSHSIQVAATSVCYPDPFPHVSNNPTIPQLPIHPDSSPAPAVNTTLLEGLVSAVIGKLDVLASMQTAASELGCMTSLISQKGNDQPLQLQSRRRL